MKKLYVIDGTDGSGKQTQVEELIKKLEVADISYKALSFPRYDNPSSTLVKEYLAGKYGKEAQDVNAYAASLFYAVDRYASYKQDFEEFYHNGGLVITDRYTTSNMIHQTAKLKNRKEQDEFLDWLWDLEFNRCGLPIPTEIFFLDMPTEYSIKLMEERENKITHGNEKDIHEKDVNHLKSAYDAACYVAKKYQWNIISCVKDGEIRTIEDINNEIFNNIKNKIK